MSLNSSRLFTWRAECLPTAAGVGHRGDGQRCSDLVSDQAVWTFRCVQQEWQEHANDNYKVPITTVSLTSVMGFGVRFITSSGGGRRLHLLLDTSVTSVCLRTCLSLFLTQALYISLVHFCVTQDAFEALASHLPFSS